MIPVDWRRISRKRPAETYPYAEVTDDAWSTVAAATWDGTVDPANALNTLTLSGPCPRCKHIVSEPVVLSADLSPAVEDFVPSLAAGEATLRCDCGRDHEGRPATGHGCGAFWRLGFQWSKGAESPAPVQLAAGRPATGDDLREMAELDTLDESELARVRAAADKWKTGLAALLGLIATVSVVKGRDSFKTLDIGTQHGIIILLGVALVAAAIAALSAMRAAYGPLVRKTLGANEQLRNLRLTAAEDARRDLRHARRLSVLVLLLLAAAVGITWWGEEPTPAMVKVTKNDDSVVCAPYAGANDKTVKFKDGSNQQGIPLTEIKSVDFRQKC